MTTLLKDIKRTVKNWWLYLLLGIFLIISGIYLLTTPEESYVALSIFFSVMIFVNGIFDIVFSISNHKIIQGWGWYLAGGLLEVVLGIVLMNYPGITMIALPLIMGFWLMFGAISTISSAFDLKSYHVKGWGWLLFLGIVLIICSFMVIGDPIVGSGSVLVFTCMAIITYGISYIILAIQLKKIKTAAGDLKKVVKEGIEELRKEVLETMESSGDSEVNKEDVNKSFDSLQSRI